MTSVMQAQQQGILLDRTAADMLSETLKGTEELLPALTQEKCVICLGTDEQVMNPCMDKTHSSACKDCLKCYITCKLDSAYPGSCPPLTCPLCVVPSGSKERPKLLNLAAVADIFDSREVVNNYIELAKGLLSFQCGGCHKRKSLFIENGSNEEAVEDMNKLYAKSLEHEVPRECVDSMIACLQQYQMGTLDLESCYRLITIETYPMMQLKSKEQEVWEIFKLILKSIKEPERKANLHLRYLRERPFISTLCCKKNHCFRCRTKEWHESKTCAENSASVGDVHVLSCPQCGISLTRGDGCDTITCLCGRQFGWANELRDQLHSNEFCATFPAETGLACARVLLREMEGDATKALAWRNKNKLSSNQSLIAHMRAKHGACLTQWCAKHVSSQNDPPVLAEAVALWSTPHTKEVNRCKHQNCIAVTSIVPTLLRDDQDRLHAATSKNPAAYQYIDKSLLSRWLQENDELKKAYDNKLNVKFADQFISLYGHYMPTFATSRHSEVVVQWAPGLSDSNLNISDDLATATRPGSRSCYPAAKVEIFGSRSKARLRILSGESNGGNMMSIGLCKRSFQKTSSNGIGWTSGSWGVSENRDGMSSGAYICGNGNEVGKWRELRCGDSITLEVDLIMNIFTMKLNDAESVYRFRIPQSDVLDPYCFGATFANDHVVRLEHCPPLDVEAKGPWLFNKEQSLMFYGFLSYHSNPYTTVTERIVSKAKEWEDMNGGESQANERFTVLRPVLQAILEPPDDIVGQNMIHIASSTTWSHVDKALCWALKQNIRLNVSTASKRISGASPNVKSLIELFESGRAGPYPMPLPTPPVLQRTIT